MLTYEDFKNKFCTFDVSESNSRGTIIVTVIASCGFTKEFSKDFVKEHEEVAKDLVARNLWDYLQNRMEE